MIGDGIDQPFKFKEDWARFKQVTSGHPLIMGRKTHDSMGLLSRRTSIVLSRNPSLIKVPQTYPVGASLLVASTFEQALDLAAKCDDQVYVVGGGQIYREAWASADELDITEVHADGAGEITFPDIDLQVWKELSREPRGEFDFVCYERNH